MSVKINILGSCVSRIIMLNGNKGGHGIASPDMELGYFLDKQNIVCAMLPSAFSDEEVASVTEAELWDGNRHKVLKQCLDKSTVRLLLESDADYVVMDLYDMQADFAVLHNTMFSTCAHEFFNTKLFRKYQGQVQTSNFMKLPEWLWYGYVDLFFERLMEKYDRNHIILNRFRSNTYYLSKAGRLERIPDSFKQPFHSNDNYNPVLRRLEDHIIRKYEPYVIDLSRFYCGDANEWENLNGAHFEKEFYMDSFETVCRIIREKPTQRNFGSPLFLERIGRAGEKPWEGVSLDVAQLTGKVLELLDQKDLLWINLLDKLYRYAPGDKRVQELAECFTRG